MNTRTVFLEADGLKIAGQLYLPGEGDQIPYPTVCLCHGIPSGSSVPGDRGYPLLAERICHQGLAVFLFNFRGTRASAGNLDILGWTRDLKAGIDYLYTLPEVDKSRLLLLGFSGGAAVAIYVASHDTRVSSVVACACPAEFTFLTEVDNPSSVVDHFRSIGAIRDKDFPHSVEEWLSGFELVSPVKYVAGIAPRPAYELYARAGEPRQIIIVEGAGHRLRLDDRAMAIVMDWLKSRCLN